MTETARRIRRLEAALDFAAHRPDVPHGEIDTQRVVARALSLLHQCWQEGHSTDVDRWIYDEICTGVWGCGSAWKWMPWDDWTDDDGNRRRGWNAGWCGATVAYILGWSERLRYDIRRHLLPSPARLLDKARCAKIGFPLADRKVDPAYMIGGDVACIDTVGGDSADHIALVWAGPGQVDPCHSVDAVPHVEVLGPGEYRTIEGNARGYHLTGEKVVGIVTNLRKIKQVRGVVRFRAEDCE